MMIIFPEIRVQLHILQEIVHPAHIPFQAESQSFILHISGHLRPGCGLLCNHHGTFVASQYTGIQMLEEVNGFQVFIIPVFVGHPLAVLLAVIQVQHRRHCVHPETVHMKFFNPVQSIGNQEIPHLIAPIIKDLRAPVRMFPLPGVRMLIAGSAVKFSQPMGIFRKMGGNPVQNHADFILMKIIHQIFKLQRTPIAGCGGIIACHLVSPGAVKGMLGNSHQLHMGIAHLFHIVHKGLGKFLIIIKPVLVIRRNGVLLPGTGMHFINHQRLLLHIKALPLFQPDSVTPVELADIHNLGCISRPELCRICIGVRFVKLFSMCSFDKEFIELSLTGPRHKCLIDADFSHLGHRMGRSIPLIKLSNYMHFLGIGRPYGEIHSFALSHCHGMGAQLLIDFIVGALPQQILI